MNRRLEPLKIVGILGILLITSCSERSSEKKEQIPVVKTTRVKSFHNLLSKSYPARIKASSDIRLSFRVAGPLSKVLVKEGEYVKKGQLLAQIDPRDYELRLKGTEAKYREIKAEVGRITALYKKGKVPENDYDKAVSGLKQITAQYEAHKNALNDTRLKAPFAGNVADVFFDTHEMVDAGMPVIALVDTQQYEIVAHLPADDYLKKNNFVDFRCRTVNHPGEEWPLTLKSIVAKGNVNGLYPARFMLSEPEKGKILPGMSARVIIQYSADDNGLLSVPSTAVFKKNEQSLVWKLDKESQTVKSVPVKIVRIDADGNAIVKGNLNTNDVVVSAGIHSIREGQKVKQLEPPAESNIGGLL